MHEGGDIVGCQLGGCEVGGFLDNNKTKKATKYRLPFLDTGLAPIASRNWLVSRYLAVMARTRGVLSVSSLASTVAPCSIRSAATVVSPSWAA